MFFIFSSRQHQSSVEVKREDLSKLFCAVFCMTVVHSDMQTKAAHLFQFNFFVYFVSVFPFACDVFLGGGS